MNENTIILAVVGLAVIFFALWAFNGKQKQKFEDERRARKRDLAALKAKAANKAEN